MNIRTLFLCVVLAALAVPSFAQKSLRMIEEPAETAGSTYDLDNYLDNPCTASYDRVWVDYSVYLEQAYADANDRVIFDEMTSVDGTYKAAGQTRSDVAYAAPFTLRKYHKVNTADDFHVVTVIDFYPSTKATYVSIETACGNGMPDAKE
jgi:hypothetical protein